MPRNMGANSPGQPLAQPLHHQFSTVTLSPDASCVLQNIRKSALNKESHCKTYRMDATSGFLLTLTLEVEQSGFVKSTFLPPHN